MGSSRFAHGEAIGSYRLIDEIGRGGMGVVYEARNVLTGKTVALKCLHAARLASDRAQRRFRREIEAIARVSHPVIVPVVDSGADDEVPWLAMPLIAGRDLAEVVAGMARRDPEVLAFLIRATPECEGLDPDDLHREAPAWMALVLRLGREVAEALAAAHAAGLVHRDVKPANVLIDETGEARLLDFGLVRDELGETMTLSEEPLGTPLYMSPEQVGGGHGRVDGRSDVYALGLTIREALTLRPPFQVDDLSSLYRAIREQDPLDVTRGNPAVGPDLARVLDAATRKDPRDRYGDAGALARDLARVAGDRTPSPPRVPLLRRAAVFARRHRVGTAIAAAITAAALFFAAGEFRGRSRVTASASVKDLLEGARVAAADSDFRAAHRALVRALEIDPRNRTALAEQEALAARLVDRIRRQLEADRYVAALGDLQQLQALYPERVVSEDMARYATPVFRKLAGIASELQQSGVAARKRALHELADESLALQLPNGVRERLVVRHLDAGRAEDPEELALAVNIAGTIDADEAVPALRTLLREPERPLAVRAAAAEALGRLGDNPSRRVLEDFALRDDVLGARAIRGLGELRNPASAALLAKALASSSPHPLTLIEALQAVLGSLRSGDERSLIRERLVTAYRGSEDPSVQERLLRLFRQLPQPATTSFLLEVLRTQPSDRLRRVAAYSLGSADDQRATAGLCAALRGDASHEVRCAAVHALRVDGAPARDALLEALKADTSPEVRARVLLALGRGRVAAALDPALAALEGSQDSRVRNGALLCLGFLRTKDERALAMLRSVVAKSPDARSRATAVWALGRLGGPSAIPLLLKVLEEESVRAALVERARSTLADAGPLVRSLLGELPSGEILPRAFLRELEHPAGVVEATIRALEMLIREAEPEVARQVLDALVEVARSRTRADLRGFAIAALGRMREEAPRAPVVAVAVPALQALWESTGDPDLRRELALAIARLGPRAIPETWLEEMPRNGDDALVRGLILLRLGRSGEARPNLIGALRTKGLEPEDFEREPEFGPLKRLGGFLGIFRDDFDG